MPASRRALLRALAGAIPPMRALFGWRKFTSARGPGAIAEGPRAWTRPSGRARTSRYKRAQALMEDCRLLRSPAAAALALARTGGEGDRGPSEAYGGLARAQNADGGWGDPPIAPAISPFPVLSVCALQVTAEGGPGPANTAALGADDAAGIARHRAATDRPHLRSDSDYVRARRTDVIGARCPRSSAGGAAAFAPSVAALQVLSYAPGVDRGGRGHPQHARRAIRSGAP